MLESEALRINYLWIEFVNTQRSNFVRAQSVGEAGLGRQAVMSIANYTTESRIFRLLWQDIRDWTSLASEDFTTAVDYEIEHMDLEGTAGFRSFPLLDRLQSDGTVV